MRSELYRFRDSKSKVISARAAIKASTLRFQPWKQVLRIAAIERVLHLRG